MSNQLRAWNCKMNYVAVYFVNRNVSLHKYKWKWHKNADKCCGYFNIMLISICCILYMSNSFVAFCVSLCTLVVSFICSFSSFVLLLWNYGYFLFIAFDCDYSFIYIFTLSLWVFDRQSHKRAIQLSWMAIFTDWKLINFTNVTSKSGLQLHIT